MICNHHKINNPAVLFFPVPFFSFSHIKSPVRKISYSYFTAQEIILHEIWLFYREKFLFLIAVADNDIKPDEGGYGCDVPDGIIYQFAEEFFNATDAPEDCEEEKFIPKPYVSTSAKPAKKAKTAEKKPKKQQNKPSGSYEQMSLEGVI